MRYTLRRSSTAGVPGSAWAPHATQAIAAATVPRLGHFDDTQPLWVDCSDEEDEHPFTRVSLLHPHSKQGGKRFRAAPSRLALSTRSTYMLDYAQETGPMATSKRSRPTPPSYDRLPTVAREGVYTGEGARTVGADASRSAWGRGDGTGTGTGTGRGALPRGAPHQNHARRRGMHRERQATPPSWSFTDAPGRDSRALRDLRDKIALRGGRDLALRTCPSSSSPALSTQRFLRERTLTRRAADIYAM